MSGINLDQCFIEESKPEIGLALINHVHMVKVDRTFDPSPAMRTNGQNLFK